VRQTNASDRQEEYADKLNALLNFRLHVLQVFFAADYLHVGLQVLRVFNSFSFRLGLEQFWQESLCHAMQATLRASGSLLPDRLDCFCYLAY